MGGSARAMASTSSCKTLDSEHKQQQSIRDTIHLLLSLLSECGMPKVPSECFRRAKYNKVDAEEALWKLTFHIMQALMVLDGGTCDGRVNTIAYLQITISNLPKMQTILRHYMLELGYEREEFYSPQRAVGSQEMLLAFAWLLQKSSFFSKLSRHFLAIANMIEIPLKSASKHLIEHVMEENRVMGCELENIMVAFRKCADNDSQIESSDSYVEALHKLVWFKGKMDAKFKSVQGLCSAYHSMADRVHRSTCTDSATSRRQGTGKGHLSTPEVFLLRYPTQMKAYLAKLRKCVSVLQKIIQWQDCESLFWQWMESILDMQEELKEKKLDKDQKEGNGVEVTTEADELPGLTAIVQKQQEEFEDLLARSKHRIDRVEHVWSQKSGILHHKDINSELNQLRNQLQFEYPITVQATNQTVLVSSRVEHMKPIDCPVYAPVQTIVRRSRHVFPTPVQLQEASDTKHIQALAKRLQAILNEVAVVDRVIKGKKTEIKDAVESLEKWLPASVCKIETNSEL